MNYLRSVVNDKLKELEDSNTKEELEELKKFKLIEKLLEDDACFFKIDSNMGYSVLVELGVDNPIQYYKKLISYEEYIKCKDNFEL